LSSRLDYAVDQVTYTLAQLKYVQTCNSTAVDLLLPLSAKTVADANQSTH